MRYIAVLMHACRLAQQDVACDHKRENKIVTVSEKYTVCAEAVHFGYVWLVDRLTGFTDASSCCIEGRLIHTETMGLLKMMIHDQWVRCRHHPERLSTRVRWVRVVCHVAH